MSLYVFLDDANRGWFDARKLALMKPSANLVNTSRWPVLDEPTLCHALRAGAIAEATLDVVASEPPAPDSPYREFDKVYITPQLGD